MSSMWRKQVAGALVSMSVLAVAAPVEAQVVRAWGDNAHGQCNPPLDLGQATQVAGGYLHTIALNASGTVRSWGYNNFGQSEPAPIPWTG
jgi:hypothetical protein